MQHIALTAAMISRHMFFGLSEKTADKRRSTHMSVARWIATLYAQNKVVTGRDLYMTLCGYCCELLYCRITNKPNRQEILRYILDNSIGSDMAITVCKILEDDEIIEKVRK